MEGWGGVGLDPLHTENLSLLTCEPTTPYRTGFHQNDPSPTSALQAPTIKLLHLLRLEGSDVGILFPSNYMELLHQEAVITELLLREKSLGGGPHF